MILFAHEAYKFRERKHGRGGSGRRSGHVDSFNSSLKRIKRRRAKSYQGIEIRGKERSICLSVFQGRFLCVPKQKSEFPGQVKHGTGVCRSYFKQGDGEACNVSTCHHHSKMHVLVPMTHR